MTSPLSVDAIERSSAMDRDWLAVAACTVCLVFSVGTLTLYCLGVFGTPLSAQFGWGRTKMIAALTIRQYVLALVLPFWASLTDRLGPRFLMPLSYVTLPLSFASLALLTPHIWHLYLVFALIPMLAGGATPLATSAVLVRRFQKHLFFSSGSRPSGYSSILSQ